MHKDSGDYRLQVFPPVVNFDFGHGFGLDVATMFDTVFQALMHVAIAPVYFFSEPLVGNSFGGRYRQNAPSPDLIVPFRMEKRGQPAKSLLSSRLDGN
jgi:hypothetical protein